MPCSGATLSRNFFPPNIKATNEMLNMLSIFAPITFPTARAGLGGSRRTAEMLVDSSGKEVANATRTLPTNNRPQPVRLAKASP